MVSVFPFTGGSDSISVCTAVFECEYKREVIHLKFSSSSFSADSLKQPVLRSLAEVDTVYTVELRWSNPTPMQYMPK